jgi:hypothetical protein
MLVDTSRNPWHVWISLLFAIGFTMDDISSEASRSQKPCVTRVAKQSHTPDGDRLRLVLCSAIVGRRCWMLSTTATSQELRLIGEQQDAVSKRQKATFVLAKWPFDTGTAPG